MYVNTTKACRIGKRQFDLRKQWISTTYLCHFLTTTHFNLFRWKCHKIYIFSPVNMLIWVRKADGENMKKLMKAKLMRKTCGERWKVNESRLPRLIQVLSEQDTLLELTLIKILFNISKPNRTRYFHCYPEMCWIYNQNTAEKHKIFTICEIFKVIIAVLQCFQIS